MICSVKWAGSHPPHPTPHHTHTAMSWQSNLCLPPSHIALTSARPIPPASEQPMSLAAVPMVIYSFFDNLAHFPEAGQQPPGPGIWWQSHPILSLRRTLLLWTRKSIRIHSENASGASAGASLVKAIILEVIKHLPHPLGTGAEL